MSVTKIKVAKCIYKKTLARGGERFEVYRRTPGTRYQGSFATFDEAEDELRTIRVMYPNGRD